MRGAGYLTSAAIALLCGCGRAGDQDARTDSPTVMASADTNRRVAADSLATSAPDSVARSRPDSSAAPQSAPETAAPTTAVDSDNVVTPQPKPEFHTPDLIAILPAPIRDSLLARRCRVPQHVGDYAGNVSRGSFYGPSQMGWAVWCEVGGRSRIFVFRDGGGVPDELRVQAAELPANDPKPDQFGRYCVGGVGAIEGKYIEATVRDGKLADVDPNAKLTAEESAAPLHDGIVDGDCEGASNVHYWTGKRWVVLPGGD